MRDGGEFARTGATAGARRGVRCWDFHKFDAGSFGLSWDDGALLCGEAEIVRGARGWREEDFRSY